MFVITLYLMFESYTNFTQCIHWKSTCHSCVIQGIKSVPHTIGFLCYTGEKERTHTAEFLCYTGEKERTPTLFVPIGTVHWEQRAYPLRSFSPVWWSAVFPPKGGTRVLPPPFPNLVSIDVVIGMFNLL